MKKRLEAANVTSGILLEDELHEDFTKLFEEQTNAVLGSKEPDSYRRLFWEQQAKALKLTDRRQVRWHPMIIKWCLRLKLLSSACYHTLRSTNALVLPPQRTL